jgi:hypothetical protein
VERIGDLLLEHAPAAGPARPWPLLLVHGMWGGSWYLRNYLYAAAREGWEAWALNLRGHGESRPVADLGRVSVLDYVEDVRDVLAALGESALLGHSMGGLIAQKAATGGGVKAAVVLTSAAPRGINVLGWPVLSRMPRYLGAMVAGRAFAVSREHAGALLFNRLSPERRDWAHARLVPESGRAARELAFGLVAVDAAAVTCPVLVMGAAEDRITPPRVQRKIATRYGAPYEEAAGHAHMLMLEDGWEGPFGTVLGWLDRVTRGR